MRRLRGEKEDQLSTVDEGLVEHVMGRVYSDILFQQWKTMPLSVGQYAKTYDSNTIEQDATTDIYYTSLPAKVLSFPDSQSGIRKISTLKGEGVDFVSEYSDNMELMEGLECDTASNVISYTLRNNRIEFKNMTNTIAASNIRIEIIIPFEEYDYEDDVLLPSGLQTQLIQVTTEYLIGKPPEDMVNNQNPNQLIPKENG